VALPPCAKVKDDQAEEAEDVTIFPRGAFCALFLLFAVSPSRADQSAAPPGSQGEYLARAGDCVACHSVPGGKAFAGGLKMGSPLANIYSTNITPDPETGIGTNSLEDFDRAVRRGVAKDGHRLYPAMPYPSYAKLTDADVAALYGFFMKEVPPVHQENLKNEIPSFLSFRWPLAIWSLVFTTSGSYVAKSGHDVEWNRGAYLVQGLGHCGACHTPRGFAFQEKALDDSSAVYLSGALLDAWYAPDLRGDVRTGLGGWSKGDLADFLKYGHNRAVTAFGSMIDVVNNSTPYLSDDDINAIAVYLKSLPATSAQQPIAYDGATTSALRSGHAPQPGAVIYTGTCANCHGFDGKGFGPYTPALAGNPTVLDNDASSLINLVLNGSNPLVIKGTPDPYRMPQFRQQHTDQDIAEVATFIRNGWGNKAPTVTVEQVAKLRKTTDPNSDQVIILKMR
jgi:mono/diheme cytochrome c family protein